MLDITIKGDRPGIALENLALELQEGIIRGYLKALLYVQGEIRREIFKWIGKTEVAPTGDLARSFAVEFQVNPETLTGGVYSDLVYARIHEYGGIIHPKRSKMLAFPFPGVSLPRGTGPRDIPNLKWRPGSNPGIAFLGQERDGKFFPLFILKRFVRIKPKHYLTKAAENSTKVVEQIIQDSIITVLK